MHHGIKGMKWGIRRFQNRDGSLTAAGVSRYRTADRDNKKRGLSDKQKRMLKRGLAVAGVAGATYAAYRLTKSSSPQLINTLRSIKKLSNEELMEKIGRLEKEKQLMNLQREVRSLSAAAEHPGKHVANEILVSAGKKTMTTIAAGGLLYAVKAAMTGSIDSRDATGYLTPKPKNK